jgi:hypothetical protein
MQRQRKTHTHKHLCHARQLRAGGGWFWIEKRDFRFNRTMAYLIALLGLADMGAKESRPVITIQAS